MAKIILPTRIFGRDVDGAMERVLNGSSTPEQDPGSQPPQTNLEIEHDVIKRFEQVGLTPKEVLFLPGKNYPNYSYESHGISMYRLGESDKVKQVAQNLGISYSNSAVEQTSGRKYLALPSSNNLHISCKK